MTSVPRNLTFAEKVTKGRRELAARKAYFADYYRRLDLAHRVSREYKSRSAYTANHKDD